MNEKKKYYETPIIEEELFKTGNVMELDQETFDRLMDEFLETSEELKAALDFAKQKVQEAAKAEAQFIKTFFIELEKRQQEDQTGED